METQTTQEFLQQIKAGKRFIPITMDVQGGKIMWLDFEQYHFYEGFFHKSHRIFSALKGGKVDYIATNIDILKEDLIGKGCLYPSGFIFHASRSGSTLLSKVMARSTDDLVISEAEPLNNIWRYFDECEKKDGLADDDKKKMYKNLVMALGRPGLKSHRYYFIKFTSFNILFFAFIHTVFPDVPSIFVRRDVDSILKSFDEQLPGWLKPGNLALVNRAANVSDIDGRTAVESFLAEAGKYQKDILFPVDYKTLAPDLLPVLLKHFNAEAREDQLALMQKQFSFDSKVEFNQKKFNPS